MDSGRGGSGDESNQSALLRVEGNPALRAARPREKIDGKWRPRCPAAGQKALVGGALRGDREGSAGRRRNQADGGRTNGKAAWAVLCRKPHSRGRGREGEAPAEP